MQAIIFADRHGRELDPLCETHLPTLMLLANRPLIEYTLDDLANTGIKEVFIVTNCARQLESDYGNGEMWGMRMHYLLSRGEESPSQIISRNRNLLSTPFIALRGDILRSPCCQEFVREMKIQDNSTSVTALQLAGKDAGVLLVQQWPEKYEQFETLAWPPDDSMQLSAKLSLKHGRVAYLDSFNSYYDACINTLEGDFALQKPVVLEIEQGLHVGLNTEISLACYNNGTVLVGEQSHISPRAQLIGPVSIGPQCFVESGACIKNSVILPGSYIGSGLQVENAIVSGHNLIRVDSNIAIKINDPEILSFIDHELDSILLKLPEQLLGTLLLLVSLPLWPLALILSLLNNTAEPWRKAVLLSNRIDTNSQKKERLHVVTIKLATGVPLLQSLPMLWLVVRGDLKLFGSTPLMVNDISATSEESLTPVWDLRRQHRSSGLIGPAQLYLSAATTEEELRINESTFNFQSGPGIMLSRLLKSIALLFTSRAWLRNNECNWANTK